MCTEEIEAGVVVVSGYVSVDGCANAGDSEWVLGLDSRQLAPCTLLVLILHILVMTYALPPHQPRAHLGPVSISFFQSLLISLTICCFHCKH